VFKKRPTDRDFLLVKLFALEEDSFEWAPQVALDDYSCDNHAEYKSELSRWESDDTPGLGRKFQKALDEAEKNSTEIMADLVETEKLCQGCWECFLTHVPKDDIECGSGFVLCPTCIANKTAAPSSASTHQCPSPQISGFPELELSSLPCIETLGSGAHGEVYRVDHEGPKAIKMYRVVAADHGQRLDIHKKFERELKALTKLANAHDNVVRIFAKETENCDHPAILMELCECHLKFGNKSEKITNLRMSIECPYNEDMRACFDRIVFVRLGIEISRAMNFVHNMNIFHRDLKPENVMLINANIDACPHAKVCDFSLSRLSYDLSQQSSHKPRVSLYKDPDESAKPSADQAKASDVYSFGWMLLEMTAGKLSQWRKKAKTDDPETLHKLKNGERDQVLLDKLPDCLATVVKECFHTAWRNRPTFKSVEERLKVYLDEESARLDTLLTGQLKESACIETATEYMGRNGNALWRVLDDRDIFWISQQKLIKPRQDHTRVQILTRKNLTSHVRHGSKMENLDQIFISTSSHLDWICWYIARKSFHALRNPMERNKCCRWYPFVRIDLEKCPEILVIDLSTVGLCRQKMDQSNTDQYDMAQGFASDASEVILIGNIPLDALEYYQIDDDDGKALGAIRGKNATEKKFDSFQEWNAVFRRSDKIGKSKYPNSFLVKAREAAAKNKLWPFPDEKSKQKIWDEFAITEGKALVIKKSLRAYLNFEDPGSTKPEGKSFENEFIQDLKSLRYLCDALAVPEVSMKAILSTKLSEAVMLLAQMKMDSSRFTMSLDESQKTMFIRLQRVAMDFVDQFKTIIRADKFSSCEGASNKKPRQAIVVQTPAEQREVKRKKVEPVSQEQNKIVEAVSNPQMEASAGISKTKWTKKCKAILETVNRHEHAWVFAEPVDSVKLNIPDYFTIIKRPMDLGYAIDMCTKYTCC
jgi:serine/threonine protein kinase